ncbi:hypothetical protein GOP47_0019540 [Adiantum capillus-veneris]|uniref:Nucleotide-diphospho-sugar transferase domain-containing protein n=1 Tax=Adiantum capillus-veneris TaxID=13818 RepID=A0A9D4UBQ1_ADICA|nr:hypothetical protein GOP47_0019540 [Adiantum capillus-veneris]
MTATKAVLAFCVCFVLLLAFYHRESLISLHEQLRLKTTSINMWEDKEQVGTLKELLQKAEMRNGGEKTVIFTSVNAAWAEPGSLLEILLESFKLLKNSRTQEVDFLKHLIVLAFDHKAYERCVEVHPLCYQVRTDGIDFSSAKPYMSHDYVKMMWRRIEFLNNVLAMGYSFIFSDADIIWLRNPFPLLLPSRDFEITTDRYNGNPNSHDNAPNGGYTFARSNKRTIKFYKFWYDSRLKYPIKHDQDVFIEIRHNKTMKDIGVNVGYLDTKFFASFCSYSVYHMNLAATIHANCCNGLHNKIRNLKMLLDDWKHFNIDNQTQRVWQRPNGCTLKPV